MLTVERHALILDRLDRDKRVLAKDLAHELGTSEDTVRRDLRELAAQGRLVRVYGGAVPVAAAASDYRTRTDLEPGSKARVAARALTLVEPGSTVILDGGTTTLALASSLPETLSCTVITHSPTIAVALVAKPLVDVHLIGGRLFRHSVVTCGAAAVEAAASLSADVFLAGVTGVHPQEGLTTGDADEAAMKRALSARAAETYVLASREKVGAVSRFRVFTPGQVTAVVSDAPEDSTIVQELAAAGMRLLPS
ncbi:DeoR/GlpR family DNA-binding transcription regulator [Kineococcus sp. SYSU DK001]|uniref:DeoR/GlpR family DNA-binding transcription regulator n=1 Tax=Kineococcus sp. SYSU DK001 TaxID=3383122 RepID=UPI003D7E5545